MIVKIRDRQAKVWVEVPATKILVPHLLPYKFYVHESICTLSFYTVSESISGAAIAHGDTKREAIKNAKDRLYNRTPEHVQWGIDRALKIIADGEA